jgi:hypothetical protein
MALGSTQPLTEMSTRNLPGGKRQPACEAYLTALCDTVVWKMWKPRRLTILWASTACYRDSFNFYLYLRELYALMLIEATPYLKRLVAGFPPRRPGFAPGCGKWDLWWTKWCQGRFSPSSTVSPAKTVDSTNFSIITITRGS